MCEQTEQCPDVAHNFTTDGNAFPILHGLILTVAVGLLFGVENKRVISLAEDLLRRNTVYLHPCIISALKLVTKVKKFHTESQQEIIQCCFLLQQSQVP
jgi:hypothetical protein